MEFLVNILLAILAFILVKYLLDMATAPNPISVVVGAVVALVVFLANPAVHVI